MGRVDLASVAFDGLALLTLGSAAVVALARDAVRSATALAGALAGVAGLYALLSADFLAVVELFVAVGGTSVVLYLAARLTASEESASPVSVSPSRRSAAITIAILAAAFSVVAAGTIWPTDEKVAAVPSASKIGHALLGRYVAPFELASVVLLTALVGSLVILRRTARDGAAP